MNRFLSHQNYSAYFCVSICNIVGRFCVHFFEYGKCVLIDKLWINEQKWRWIRVCIHLQCGSKCNFFLSKISIVIIGRCVMRWQRVYYMNWFFIVRKRLRTFMHGFKPNIVDANICDLILSKRSDKHTERERGLGGECTTTTSTLYWTKQTQQSVSLLYQFHAAYWNKRSNMRVLCVCKRALYLSIYTSIFCLLTHTLNFEWNGPWK